MYFALLFNKIQFSLYLIINLKTEYFSFLLKGMEIVSKNY